MIDGVTYEMPKPIVTKGRMDNKNARCPIDSCRFAVRDSYDLKEHYVRKHLKVKILRKQKIKKVTAPKFVDWQKKPNTRNKASQNES